LQHTILGKTQLKVSQIGFGCARLEGIFSQSKSHDETIYVLQQALGAGITFFDTSNIYSQGESEVLLGKAFRDRRDQVIIASKGGYNLPAQRKLIARLKPLVKPLVHSLGIKRENLPARVAGSLTQDFSGTALTQALEASLRRLKTDYLDLYQLHSPPAAVIQVGEFIETLERLKMQGKIRFYGISADTVEDALLCLQYPGISTIQVPFGLLDQEAQTDLFAEATARGVALIARGCYGAGLLNTALSEQQLQEMTPKWPRIMTYRRIATQHNRHILEMALQFSLRFKRIAVTLIGMRTIAHLRDNLQYAAAQPLSDEEYTELIA
jgi:aryl-alcohol dehydrogenase-like predicted oxidoreductase